MTKKLELLRCNLCQNLVEVINEGQGELVCCNEEMKHLIEHEVEENNPHYAHIERIDNLTKKITFNHVMTPEHHLEFIEVISNDLKYIKRKCLNFDETPELTFRCECKEGFFIRLYCNVDGVLITRI